MSQARFALGEANHLTFHMFNVSSRTFCSIILLGVIFPFFQPLGTLPDCYDCSVAQNLLGEQNSISFQQM